MMGVFCDRLSFGSIAALNCHTGQDRGRYCKKELLLLLVLLCWSIMTTVAWSVRGSFEDCFGESLGGHVVRNVVRYIVCSLKAVTSLFWCQLGVLYAGLSQVGRL